MSSFEDRHRYHKVIYNLDDKELDDISILYEEKFERTKGEKDLWRAVITQALMDAGSNSKKREMQYAQSQAVSWLSGRSEDFLIVCQFADINPNYVRDKSGEAIKRGCEWRKDKRIKEHFKRLNKLEVKEAGESDDTEQIGVVVNFVR